MKKSITISILLLSILTLSVPIFSHAQEREYVLLSPLPLGDGGATLSKTNFSDYITGMYQFVLGVAGILAVIMIIFAGFTYMTTDAFQKKQDGRERIKNAILGLLLAIGTWLILNTINPELLNFNLTIERPKITTPEQPATLLVGSLPTGLFRAPGCETCINLSGPPYNLTIVNTNPGATPELAQQLSALELALAGRGIDLLVTGGFPPSGYSEADPTGIHSNACHGNGTCVDIDISVPNAQNIQQVFNESKRAGLHACYEVPTDAERDALIGGGADASNIVVVKKITGTHFSIYNSPRSCQSS